jgi:pyruvate dehydrogenase E2 component (dihydrolipoamide acetyltransferase)
MSATLTAIPMPQMGVSVTEGVVTAWLKAEGDWVEADEIVCEITTDKVDTEVVAPSAGTLAKIVAAAGTTVPVGAPLAMLASGDIATVDPDDPATTDVEPAPPAQAVAAAALAAVPAFTNGRLVASPVARRIAGEHGIDLAGVEGTGLRGRIRKSDVLALIDRGVMPAPPAGDADGLPAGYAGVPHRIVPTSPTRRAIAEHMVRSRRTAAHMTTEVDVDMHRVTTVRAGMNAERSARGASKLSFLPFVARAACAALADFPDLNATFAGEHLIQWTAINLAIAVDTDRGLLAPVIRDCGNLTVSAIGDHVRDLAARARDRALAPDDLAGGTFTLSNPGSAGAVSAMAIINQPQVAILGMPAIVRRPVVITGPDGDEAVAIRPMMQLALTFDHRAVDGAQATRCAVAIKKRLETWDAEAYA